MPDQPGEWVWTLTCRHCGELIDFSAVHHPTRRLAEWAKCCGESMQLKSVLRIQADA